ncbi:MAG: peptide ABC transporter substrate-binding protein [Clostridia bacterium]|nr:peptide ABC transporter substrate-binding protein [Clostridia bacterium]
MKKLLSLILAIMMITSSLVAFADAGSEPAWTEYDALIAQIKTTTDTAEREALMHKAEDMLMETNALVPIYYYNDIYLLKEGVEGLYSSPYGTKYFQYVTNGDATELSLNLSSEPDKLDPALSSSVDGACLATAAFGGLYTYDVEGNVVPNFAEGYTTNEDGTVYTFTLKDGLKWSNGDALTAKDFEYSWKRAAATETAADYSYMLNGIKGYPDALAVTASEDGKTLTVELVAPCVYFLDLAAFPTFYPVHQASVEAAEGYKAEDGSILNPGAWALEAGFVSCGPYMLTEWKHNESMTYTKNPYWYDAANVKMETLKFMLSADDTAIYAAYQAGDLQFADTVPTDLIASLIDTPEFHIVDELGTYYAIFNVKSKLFDGKTVEQANAMRKAFALLIDRQYIIDTVGQTGQAPANSFIPAGMLDGNGGIFKANDDAYTFPCAEETGYYSIEIDVDAAVELLKTAGYEFDANNMLSAATPITLEYLTNESSGHVAIAECIQQDLAAVGITMTIRTCDWNVFLNDRKNGNYDFARNGWIADFNDPINMLEMWETNSGNNDAQFGR